MRVSGSLTMEASTILITTQSICNMISQSWIILRSMHNVRYKA